MPYFHVDMDADEVQGTQQVPEESIKWEQVSQVRTPENPTPREIDPPDTSPKSGREDPNYIQARAARRPH